MEVSPGSCGEATAVKLISKFIGSKGGHIYSTDLGVFHLKYPFCQEAIFQNGNRLLRDFFRSHPAVFELGDEKTIRFRVSLRSTSAVPKSPSALLSRLVQMLKENGGKMHMASGWADLKKRYRKEVAELGSEKVKDWLAKHSSHVKLVKEGAAPVIVLVKDLKPCQTSSPPSTTGPHSASAIGKLVRILEQSEGRMIAGAAWSSLQKDHPGLADELGGQKPKDWLLQHPSLVKWIKEGADDFVVLVKEGASAHCCQFLLGECKCKATCSFSHAIIGTVTACSSGESCRHGHWRSNLTVKQFLQAAASAAEPLPVSAPRASASSGKKDPWEQSDPWGGGAKASPATSSSAASRSAPQVSDSADKKDPWQEADPWGGGAQAELAAASSGSASSSAPAPPKQESVEDKKDGELCRVMAAFEPKDGTQLRVIPGDLVVATWRQPADEGGYWAWVHKPEHLDVEGYVPQEVLGEPMPMPPPPQLAAASAERLEELLACRESDSESSAAESDSEDEVAPAAAGSSSFISDAVLPRTGAGANSASARLDKVLTWIVDKLKKRGELSLGDIGSGLKAAKIKTTGFGSIKKIVSARPDLFAFTTMKGGGRIGLKGMRQKVSAPPPPPAPPAPPAAAHPLSIADLEARIVQALRGAGQSGLNHLQVASAIGWNPAWKAEFGRIRHVLRDFAQRRPNLFAKGGEKKAKEPKRFALASPPVLKGADATASSHDRLKAWRVSLDCTLPPITAAAAQGSSSPSLSAVRPLADTAAAAASAVTVVQEKDNAKAADVEKASALLQLFEARLSQGPAASHSLHRLEIDSQEEAASPARGVAEPGNAAEMTWYEALQLDDVTDLRAQAPPHGPHPDDAETGEQEETEDESDTESLGLSPAAGAAADREQLQPQEEQQPAEEDGSDAESEKRHMQKEQPDQVSEPPSPAAASSGTPGTQGSSRPGPAAGSLPQAPAAASAPPPAPQHAPSQLSTSLPCPRVEVQVDPEPLLSALQEAFGESREALTELLSSAQTRLIHLQLQEQPRVVFQNSSDDDYLPTRADVVTAEELGQLQALLGLADVTGCTMRGLHKAFVVRTADGDLASVTFHIGRVAKHSSSLCIDIWRGGCAMLIAGVAGSGKTQMLRDAATSLSLRHHVVVLDNGELFGTAPTLPKDSGRVARVMLKPGANLRDEAVTAISHFAPRVLVADFGEVTEALEVARLCKDAGVHLLAAARGQFPSVAAEIAAHPVLRTGIPFDGIFELCGRDFNAGVAFHDAKRAVTSWQNGQQVLCEVRQRDPQTGSIQVTPRTITPPGWSDQVPQQLPMQVPLHQHMSPGPSRGVPYPQFPHPMPYAPMQMPFAPYPQQMQMQMQMQMCQAAMTAQKTPLPPAQASR